MAEFIRNPVKEAKKKELDSLLERLETTLFHDWRREESDGSYVVSCMINLKGEFTAEFWVDFEQEEPHLKGVHFLSVSYADGRTIDFRDDDRIRVFFKRLNQPTHRQYGLYNKSLSQIEAYGD